MAPYRLKSESWIISFGPSIDAASRQSSVTSSQPSNLCSGDASVGAVGCSRSIGQGEGGLLDGVAMLEVRLRLLQKAE